MVLIEIILPLVLIILITIQWHRKKDNHLPGPWNLPILGYLPWLNPKTPQLSLMALSKKYGPIYQLNLGNIHTVVVSDVKILKKMFLKDSVSGRAPLHFIDSIFGGKGLIFTQGDLWKKQRKFVHDFLRTVGANKVSQNKHKLENVIMESALELVQYIEAKGNNNPLNISEDIVHNVGIVISSIVLGKTWSRDDPTWRQLIQFLDDGAKLLGVAAPLHFLPWLSILPTYRKNKSYLITALKITHEKYKEIISSRKETNDENSSTNLVESFILERRKQRSNSYFTDQQFYYLLSDVFGAGLETTVNSLLWFILYMAKYQDVQSRVRQELRDILQGSRPKIDDMPMSPYTEATIAEVSRIRTVVPLGVPHGVLEDMETEEFTIRKGTMVMPLMWAIHMNPEIWGDPENFRPERFINKEGKFHKPESFIPFQIGKRMCVGEDLAKMILYLFGITLLQAFKIEPEAGKEVDLEGICGLTLAPKPQRIIFTKL